MVKSAPSDEPRGVKGFVIKGLLTFVEERFGQKAMRELAAGMTDDPDSLEPGSWYPAEPADAMFQSVAEDMCAGSSSSARAIGRCILEEYKKIWPTDFIWTFGSDARAVINRIWLQVYRAGHFEFTDTEKGFRARLVEFKPLEKLKMEAIAGAMEMFLESLPLRKCQVFVTEGENEFEVVFRQQ